MKKLKSEKLKAETRKVRMKNGMPGVFEVLEELPNNRLRILRHPARPQDRPTVVYASDVEDEA